VDQPSKASRDGSLLPPEVATAEAAVTPTPDTNEPSSTNPAPSGMTVIFGRLRSAAYRKMAGLGTSVIWYFWPSCRYSVLALVSKSSRRPYPCFYMRITQRNSQ